MHQCRQTTTKAPRQEYPPNSAMQCGYLLSYVEGQMVPALWLFSRETHSFDFFFFGGGGGGSPQHKTHSQGVCRGPLRRLPPRSAPVHTAQRGADVPSPGARAARPKGATLIRSDGLGPMGAPRLTAPRFAGFCGETERKTHAFVWGPRENDTQCPLSTCPK